MLPITPTRDIKFSGKAATTRTLTKWVGTIDATITPQPLVHPERLELSLLFRTRILSPLCLPFPSWMLVHLVGLEPTRYF